MLIDIISIFYPPEKGAAPARISKLASVLATAGHDVEIVTALPSYPTGRIFPAYRGRLRTFERRNGVRVMRAWAYPSNSSRPLARVANMTSFAMGIAWFVPRLALARRPDVVIVQSPPFAIGLAGVIAGRLCGARVILNVSDLWPTTALDLGVMSRGTTFDFLVAAERWMYRTADAVVGQSSEILARVRQMAPGKSTFLYSNLDKPGPAPQRAIQSSAEHGDSPGGRLRIAYAGLLGVAQGVLEICKNVDFDALGAELHIFGEGRQLEAVEHYAAITTGIIYRGTLPKHELDQLMPTFDASLVPLTRRIRGAVPSKVYAGIAAGVPLLFVGEGEGAEIVREHGIGLVSSAGDFSGLRANVAALTQMTPAERAAMRTRMERLQVGEFSFRRQAAEFLDWLGAPGPDPTAAPQSTPTP